MLCLWHWGGPAGWQKVPDSVRRGLWRRSAVRSCGASGLWSEVNCIFLPMRSTLLGFVSPLLRRHHFVFQPTAFLSLNFSYRISRPTPAYSWNCLSEQTFLALFMRSWGSHSAVIGKLGWSPRSEGCLLCCSGFAFLIWKWMGKDNSKGFLLFCNFLFIHKIVIKTIGLSRIGEARWLPDFSWRSLPNIVYYIKSKFSECQAVLWSNRIHQFQS